MSLVKSDESHARRLASCRGSFSPDDVFFAIALRPRAGPDAPILSSCVARFPTEDHRAAFEGRREGNQAAGISDISGFAARRPAGRGAIAAQASSFSRRKAQPHRHSGPARAWNDPCCSNRWVLNSKSGG